MFGSTVALREWRGLVALGLITVGVLCKLSIEEQFLTEQFGEAYRRYRVEVPALF